MKKSNPDRAFINLILLFALASGAVIFSIRTGHNFAEKAVELCNEAVSMCAGATAAFTPTFQVVIALFAATFPRKHIERHCYGLQDDRPSPNSLRSESRCF